jgi:hypothetical protein
MKWLKSALVGALASLVMFIIIAFSIKSGVAPFNVPPSAAFLEKLGINVGPVALLVHFGYGAFWSMVLVGIFSERTDLVRGICLALILWLVMMIAYSPMIGWGLFGFGSAGASLPPDNPLYLAPGPKYLIATLFLHLIYGAIIGWLNPLWLLSGRAV